MRAEMVAMIGKDMFGIYKSAGILFMIFFFMGHSHHSSHNILIKKIK
jgi:hypothetical protein